MPVSSTLEHCTEDQHCWPIGYDICHVNKHGFLGCGFKDGYSIAESFMLKAAFYDSRLRVDLSTSDISNISTKRLHGEYCLDDYHIVDMFERIFSKCVYYGWFFNGFLKACAETKFLDKWLLSERFMSNVHAGSIRAHWSVICQHEHGTKEPYRSRFRVLIKSLDDRGLHWTERYLEPDSFWGKKEVYWT